MKSISVVVLVFSLILVEAFGFFNFGQTNQGKTQGQFGASAKKIAETYVNGVRGISVLESEQYKPHAEFTCGDGKTVIPFAAVNDEFCDCDDGSDEPGTSACPNSQFRCVNKGYKMVTIPSSRVDDGICDCCDGSDEGVVTPECPNSCDVYASKQRAMMEKVANAFKTGNAVRLNYADKASADYADALLSIEKLQGEDAALREQKELATTLVQNEEVLEKNEKKEVLLQTNKRLDAALKLSDLDMERLGQLLQSLFAVLNVPNHEVSSMVRSLVFDEPPEFPNATPLSSSADDAEEEDPNLEDIDLDEEQYLGQTVGDDDEGNDSAAGGESAVGSDQMWFQQLNAAEQTQCLQLTRNLNEASLFPVCKHQVRGAYPVAETAKMLVKELVGTKKSYREVQYAMIGVLVGKSLDSTAGVQVDGETSVTEKPYKDIVVEYTKSHLMDSVEDCKRHHGQSPTSSFCSLHQELEQVYQPYGYGSKFTYERAEAATARGQLMEVDKRLGEVAAQKRKDESTTADYGKYSEYLPFLALKDQCFEVKEADKFVYTLCMFGTIQQKEMHGSRNTVTLGTFEKFSEDADGSVTMHFGAGTNCWAHGPRKADVKVVCGVTNLLKEAREPSTCFYTMELESPAVCTPKYAAIHGIEV